jgi:hypothetical protein
VKQFKEYFRYKKSDIVYIAVTFLSFTTDCLGSHEQITQLYNNRGNYKSDVAITIIHDDKRMVTCYLAQNPTGSEVSISCISDKQRFNAQSD